MRLPAPWMKYFEINKLQTKRDHWRLEAQSKQTPQLWGKSRAIRNKIKSFINEKKTSFYEKVFQSKNKNDKWKTLKVNECFNKTAEQLVGKRKTDNANLQSCISSLKDKSNSFKLRLVILA